MAYKVGKFNRDFITDMKFFVVCLLLWAFGFFISFDKAHSEIESQWGEGVFIMWGSLIFLYF